CALRLRDGKRPARRPPHVGIATGVGRISGGSGSSRGRPKGGRSPVTGLPPSLLRGSRRSSVSLALPERDSFLTAPPKGQSGNSSSSKDEGHTFRGPEPCRWLPDRTAAWNPEH